MDRERKKQYKNVGKKLISTYGIKIPYKSNTSIKIANNDVIAYSDTIQALTSNALFLRMMKTKRNEK